MTDDPAEPEFKDEETTQVDPIEISVDDLPTWAAFWKNHRPFAEVLLRWQIFQSVNAQDVPHTVATISYQEMQYQWVLNHVKEPVSLKVVKPSANRPREE